MTAREAQRVVSSLTTLMANARATKVTNLIWAVTLPIQGHDGQKLRIYIYHQDQTKRVILTDGGYVIRSINRLGSPHLRAIQSLLATFGVSLMEDMTIMEKTKRPISIRMLSYLQAWCAMDGMFRVWNSTKTQDQGGSVECPTIPKTT